MNKAGRQPTGPGGLLSHRHRRFDQPKMPCHRPKIAVVVQQWPAVLDAPCSNQQVDGLADGDAALAQGTEITGRYDRNLLPGHWHYFEAQQQGLDFSRCPLATKTLQHLAKHQIPNDDFVRTQYRAQPPDMGRISAIEEVDPDAAVDNDQAVPRPLRLRARLPRQRYLPKAAPASCCRRNLIIKRSACSTVCFLVACPEAFWASAISVSSISILVRIGVVPLVCVYINDKIHTYLAQWPACRMFTGETWSGHPPSATCPQAALHITEHSQMATARVFRSGNSQA